MREVRKFFTLISFVIKHFHVNCRRAQNRFHACQCYLVNEAGHRTGGSTRLAQNRVSLHRLRYNWLSQLLAPIFSS